LLLLLLYDDDASTMLLPSKRTKTNGELYFMIDEWVVYLKLG
jgi:hypothetical protein